MTKVCKLNKKALSIFLSLTMLFPIKSSATDVLNQITVQNPVSAKTENQITADNDKSDTVLAKILFGVFACFALTLTGFEIKDELEYKRDIECLSNQFSSNFGNNTTGCQITKRQEGRMWCWLACLQGLLGYHGVERTQKEIFKGISNSWFVPAMEHNRNSGLSIYSSEENMKSIGKFKDSDCDLKNTIFPYMIKDYVEKVSDNDLTYQILYINKNLDDDGIKNTILHIYKKIGKRPFSLLANHTSCGHFINIRKIDGNGIMYIEDPAFQKGRKESIDSYVHNFDIGVKNMVNRANGIILGFVIEKDLMLNNSYGCKGLDRNYSIA